MNDRSGICAKGENDPVRHQQTTEENFVETEKVTEYFGKFWLICHTDM